MLLLLNYRVIQELEGRICLEEIDRGMHKDGGIKKLSGRASSRGPATFHEIDNTLSLDGPSVFLACSPIVAPCPVRPRLERAFRVKSPPANH